MAVSHELILEPADLDRLSIKCKSCHAELVLSLGKIGIADDTRSEKRHGMPVKCPSCTDEWTDLHHAVKYFGHALDGLKQYGVSFRLPMPAREGKGE